MPPLSAERWRLLSPYLDQAFDLSADAREAWLASVSKRDPSLGADLQALLAEHETVAALHFLERPVRHDFNG